MSRESEREIQDFLDGRLSAAERESLEARLRNDSELARRVAEYREIRQALRDDREQLSPGFYARARARFEASAPGARSAWSRLVSWEAAGLAAAALLIMVLFGPQLFDRRLPAPGVDRQAAVEQEPPREDSDAVTPEKKESSGRRDALPGDLETDVSEGDAPIPPAGTRAEADVTEPIEQPQRRRSVDQPRPLVRQSVAEPTAPPAPAADSVESPGADISAVAEKAAAVSREPAAGAATDPEQSAAPEALGRNFRVEGASRPAESDEYAPDVRMLRGIALPADALQRGTLGTIETKDEWDAFVRGPGRAVFAGADYDSVQRLVLIGPRDRPFDCARIRTLVTAEAHVLILEHSSPGDAPPATGCAVFLPRDGKRVTLEIR